MRSKSRGGMVPPHLPKKCDPSPRPWKGVGGVIFDANSKPVLYLSMHVIYREADGLMIANRDLIVEAVNASGGQT